MKKIQGKHKEVQHIQQLRSSVICDWLKKYNLREVQYFCGHCYISSTEAYSLVDIEQLTTGIEQSHPFG